MPVRNGDKYLEESIRSILSQTYVNWELNIFDNFSTDQTVKICKKYSDKHVRINYYVNDRNIGAAKNFNLIASRAQYDYFMWFACDDLISDNFLEVCVNTLERNKRISMVFSGLRNIDTFGAVTRDYPEIFNLSEDKHWLAGYKYIYHKEVDGKANLIYSLMRTSLILNYIEDHKLGVGWGADMAFVSGLIQRSGIVITNRALFYKRIATTTHKLVKESESVIYQNYIPLYQIVRYFIEYVKNLHYVSLLGVILVTFLTRLVETVIVEVQINLRRAFKIVGRIKK